jgi:hypothetical protein
MEQQPVGSDAERIARLEERMAVLHALLTEIRADQKAMADTISRASGGMRVLLLLGGLAGTLGVLRGIGASFAAWLTHGGH